MVSSLHGRLTPFGEDTGIAGAAFFLKNTHDLSITTRNEGLENK
jgi:hypothetical protein